MATTKETTVKISKWLVDEIDDYVNRNKRNKSDFPSKRNFVDRAVMRFLEENDVNLNSKGGKIGRKNKKS